MKKTKKAGTNRPPGKKNIKNLISCRISRSTGRIIIVLTHAPRQTTLVVAKTSGCNQYTVLLESALEGLVDTPGVRVGPYL